MIPQFLSKHNRALMLVVVSASTLLISTPDALARHCTKGNDEKRIACLNTEMAVLEDKLRELIKNAQTAADSAQIKADQASNTAKKLRDVRVPALTTAIEDLKLGKTPMEALKVKRLEVGEYIQMGNVRERRFNLIGPSGGQSEEISVYTPSETPKYGKEFMLMANYYCVGRGDKAGSPKTGWAVAWALEGKAPTYDVDASNLLKWKNGMLVLQNQPYQDCTITLVHSVL